jgi:hypothetical protein
MSDRTDTFRELCVKREFILVVWPKFDQEVAYSEEFQPKECSRAPQSESRDFTWVWVFEKVNNIDYIIQYKQHKWLLSIRQKKIYVFPVTI